MSWVEENDWSICNGSMKREEEEEFTFTGGKRNTIIDFVIGRRNERKNGKSKDRGQD